MDALPTAPHPITGAAPLPGLAARPLHEAPASTRGIA